MSTWANIVKKTTGAQKSQQQVAGTAGSAQVPDYVDKRKLEEEWFLRDRATQESNLESLEKESQTQCRPTWMSLVRPDAPKALPIFKTEEDMHIWHHSEFNANRKYSDQMYNQRLDEWRVRNNWLIPLSKTTVSQDERNKGFYLSTAGSAVYITPFSTRPDLAYDSCHIQESLLDMMWCLIHSRSHELVACATVAEFKALFERNVHLEPHLRHAHVYNRNKKLNFPLKILWLFSQKANVFPGVARQGTARWTKDPVCPKSPGYMFRPTFDTKVYTKSMVFFNTNQSRNSANELVVGQHGGREETGICVVEKLKEHGDAAKIRWLLSAKQLHEMEHVSFEPECSPFRTHDYSYSSDEC
jgi:hypothetical protein